LYEIKYKGLSQVPEVMVLKMMNWIVWKLMLI